jgi:hypothetical protein
VAAASVLATGCGGATTTASIATRTTPSVASVLTTAAPAATTSAPKPRPKPKPQPNPGSLPQTDQLPSAGTPAFQAEMAALWKGVTTNSLTAALPAFFPEGAYAQLKQIADAQGDWADRLVADYRLDIAAAHALLGGGSAGARLVAVRVPAGYAHWVSPGACYNGVGYYEVPNARIVYAENGVVHSFGIASMISWRGVWYVVHLGAILRPGAGGVVDDPASGPGESVPSSTC